MYYMLIYFSRYYRKYYKVTKETILHVTVYTQNLNPLFLGCQ